MAKEHIVALWCDICIDRGERVDGETITLLNTKGEVVDIEICEDDKSSTEFSYADLQQVADHAGRLHGASESRDPAEALRDAYYDSVNLFCPLGCNSGKPFKSLQGKRQHLTNQHGAGES